MKAVANAKTNVAISLLLVSSMLTAHARTTAAATIAPDLTLTSVDIQFFYAQIRATYNDQIFRIWLESDIASIAEGYPEIERINVKSWSTRFCVIRFTFVPGLSSTYKVLLQSQVQSIIQTRWYTRYVEPNYIICIPENPFCPPWPGYVIGELIIGLNDAGSQTGVIEATVRNNGQMQADNVIVQFFDRDPSTNDYSQIGADQTIGSIDPQGAGIARLLWNEENQHDICAKIDPYDGIAESNERNNQACMHDTKTIYVDDDFADDPANHRWDSIQEGLNDADEGDTIIVYPGTYAEDINFPGPNVVLTSSAATDPETIKTTLIEGIIRFRGTEGPACTLKGFNINGSVIGYDWTIDPTGKNHTHATVSYCIFENILTGCGAIIRACDGTISNCLIANISYMCRRAWPVPIITDCGGVIRNCTMINMKDGIEVLDGQTCIMRNCIIHRSSPIDVSNGGTAEILYSHVDRYTIMLAGTVIWDPNTAFADPCFADVDNGDYHLKSQAGRWDASEGRWVKDDTTSPCIDAGDPMTPIGREPFPNGGIINMGFYGGTTEASKSYFDKPPCQTIIAGDINGDCAIDHKDLTIALLHWLENNTP